MASICAMGSKRWTGLAGVAAGAIGLACTGCISVYHYQPLSGLHRSYALSYKETNFSGLVLRLTCIPGEFIDEAASGALCDKVRTVFEGQGARILDGEDAEPAAPAAPEVAAASDPAVEPGNTAYDYDIAFEAKQTYLQRNTWMWPVRILLLTMFPVEQEYGFEQSVTITRFDGTPVGRQAFEARFIWYWGLGYWGLNKLFNVTVRPESEKVSDANMRRDFSRDFYSLVSQAVYNARARDLTRGLTRGLARDVGKAGPP